MFENYKVFKYTLAGRPLVIETGKLAGLANGSCLVRYGETVVLVQDLLVFPQYQRRGIGTALMRAMMDRFANVRQFQLLTDDTEKTLAFYRSLGLHDISSLGCQGFMR